MNKKLKNALTVTGAATLTAAAVYGLNVLDEKRDRKRYPQTGRMVEVRGHKMHVYSCGTGANTIVMITGRGTPTPSIDFEPLTAKLCSQYRVAIPEPFGYGYSDKTTEPRTVQNIVGEMREGLRKAGIFPPYVLLAHSMGGIASLYWAAHFPREVASVIGLDTALPAQGRDYERSPAAKPIRRIATFLSKITPVRLFVKCGLMDDQIKPYTGGQAERLPIVRSHTANIKTSFGADNELFAVPQNCAEVAGLNYPASCPVLMLVASESCDVIRSNPGVSMDWMGEHERIAMRSPNGKCVLLEGGHYLHHTASEAITAEILSFVPPEESHAPHLKKFIAKR